jgi:purine-binding chemotaxis protein CheW
VTTPGGRPGAPGAMEAGPGDRDAILRERARELAAVRERRAGARISVLPFEVGGERYGVEVTAVHQVVDAARVSPLLGTPRGVIGAVVSRTRPVAVLDLRHLLGLEGGGLSDLQHVVVLEDEGDLFGVAVERVTPRLDLETNTLHPPKGGPFKWIATNRLAILDPSKLDLAARVER